MKLILESWRSFLQEAVRLICPPATQDLELNTKNRNSAIQAEHIQYGPLNLEDEITNGSILINQGKINNAMLQEFLDRRDN